MARAALERHLPGAELTASPDPATASAAAAAPATVAGRRSGTLIDPQPPAPQRRRPSVGAHVQGSKAPAARPRHAPGAIACTGPRHLPQVSRSPSGDLARREAPPGRAPTLRRGALAHRQRWTRLGDGGGDEAAQVLGEEHQGVAVGALDGARGPPLPEVHDHLREEDTPRGIFFCVKIKLVGAADSAEGHAAHEGGGEGVHHGLRRGRVGEGHRGPRGRLAQRAPLRLE
mmetsp:Transcript_26974/g.90300  ORF Transcript_26974/g.90300 Transcript_26974/m.90300 type:complete len:230 (+) Transcript_26974:104-793(+)